MSLLIVPVQAKMLRDSSISFIGDQHFSLFLGYCPNADHRISINNAFGDSVQENTININASMSPNFDRH